MTQTMLTGFYQKGTEMDVYSKEVESRRYNNLIFDWDIEYQGYQRKEVDIPEGYVDFHVIIEIVEAIVTVRDKKTYKKGKKPGYKLTVSQAIAYPEEEWESFIIYDEQFKKEQLNKAFDVCQGEILNIQNWITIAESRASLIPKKKDVFECMFCGWVTDQMGDDITCHGCGKRFWSDKMWGK